ncbi:ABC transporter ATP-binding protein [Paenibacillus sp. J31TS4]|uniref:ABC transporter ATP-binding protein n=1 Tax=Paenibacillus sp. J31TS4 TaxID=2807195 RepID=UPI001B218688|nr:ABC transporter ATP-binding protein [Paenibacillus sp. J31TS4]GIP40214.1 ABC transporter ATP-binding protein [Paenibacillus sp. J31TS4]
MALIELKNITVAYDQKHNILENFNLSVEEGEFVSLLGPSGCGKTTTLRLIAGFNEAKDGQFLFKGQDYTKVPVHKRAFGFVFQSHALFPHLSVYDNVAFGLKLRKTDAKQIRTKVMDILEAVNLKGFENRYPSQLSGGQRQRVAIARSLVIQPDLLLFDEPLSSLDANLRVQMRMEIRRIQQELKVTTVYVSHDQEECFSISDKVAIMNKGVIEQLDTPPLIYKKPKTEFVARFVGFENILPMTGSGEGAAPLKAKDGTPFVVEGAAGMKGTVKCAIRPDDIRIAKDGEERGADNSTAGRIQVTTYLGRGYQYVVETAIGEFLVNSHGEAPFGHGETVRLDFPPDKLVPVD